MALNADASAIQYKLLNTSKGPAVQAPRAQCDKKVYQFRMKHILELTKNLNIFEFGEWFNCKRRQMYRCYNFY